MMRAEPEVMFSWSGPPAIRLLRRTVVAPSGEPYPAHWLEAGDGSPGVVAVAHDGESVVFVEAPRPAVGETLLELPRGFGRAQPSATVDDAACTDARRELAEETGYASEAVAVLGTYIVDSSVYPAPVIAVECRVDRSRAPGGTDGETVGVRWVPWARIPSALVDGSVRDAHSLSALALALARRAGGDVSRST